MKGLIFTPSHPPSLIQGILMWCVVSMIRKNDLYFVVIVNGGPPPTAPAEPAQETASADGLVGLARLTAYIQYRYQAGIYLDDCASSPVPPPPPPPPYRT